MGERRDRVQVPKSIEIGDGKKKGGAARGFLARVVWRAGSRQDRN